MSRQYAHNALKTSYVPILDTRAVRVVLIIEKVTIPEIFENTKVLSMVSIRYIAITRETCERKIVETGEIYR